MGLGRKIVKGSAILGTGQVIAYGSSFVRNMIFARMLSKSDFGITAAIGIGVTVFELAGKLSIGQQVVQSKEGDSERFQATAQLCQFVAGCWSAALIALCGKPLAVLFKVPQATWAFRAAGLLCLMNGLQHLDVTRLVRSLSFGKRWVVDVVPEVILVAVAFPAVLWLRDYRAVVLLLVAKAGLQLTLSHALAERRYTWSADREAFRQILRFGAPLVLNAFLMFGYQQADQAVIGAVYSVADLAGYSLAFTITMMPGYMVQGVMISVMLPLLSQVQLERVEFQRRYRLCVEFVGLGSAVVSGFLVLFGEGLIVTMFGQKYAGSGAIVAWLATANAFRLIRSAPTLAAMALGDTVNNVFANTFRVLSFGLVAAAAWVGKPPVWVAACGCVGEVLALSAATARLQRVQGVPRSIVLRPAVLCVSTVASAGLLSIVAVSRLGWVSALIISLLFSFGSLSVALRSFGVLRKNIDQLLVAAHAPRTLLRVAALLSGAQTKSEPA